jgi:hypothetical protein
MEANDHSAYSIADGDDPPILAVRKPAIIILTMRRPTPRVFPIATAFRTISRRFRLAIPLF